MVKNSVLSLPKAHHKSPRNVFDLSQSHKFTASAGMLLPAMTLDVQPHDHFEIDINNLCRANALKAPAFLRAKEHFEFFYVPYRLLWSPFNSWFTNVQDFNSTSISSTDIEKGIPVIKLKYLSALLTGAAKSRAYGIHADGTKFDDFQDVSTSSHYNHGDDLGGSVVCGMQRLLDLFGFPKDYVYPNGNVDPIVFDPTIVKSEDSDKSSFGGRRAPVPGVYERTFPGSLGDPTTSGTFEKNPDDRITDVPASYTDWLSAFRNFENLSICPFRFLAYNKIYYDHYALDDYEYKNNRLWNVDKVDYDSVAYKLFSLKYRNYNRDLRTNIYNSPLWTADYHANNYAYENSSLPSNIIGLYGGNPVLHDQSVSLGPVDSHNFTVQNLRAAFALDKLLRTQRFAPKNYRAQISARFGFTIPDDRTDLSQFIGSYDSYLNTSEVVSTSDAGTRDSSRLGEVGGRIVNLSSSDKVIKFDVPEHGLIMCIYSIEPLADYDNDGFNPFFFKLKREDYYNPEYDDLGLQPVYKRDFFFKGDDTVEDFNGVLGFQPRYSEYKTSLDLNHGQFMSGLGLDFYSTHRNVRGVFDNYMFRYETLAEGLSLGFQKILPSSLDSVFGLRYDGCQSTDQFIIDFSVRVTAIRDMSVHGEPNTI